MARVKFRHPDINMLNSKHHIQLGPNDSVSFPAVCGAKQGILYFIFLILIFEVIKKNSEKHGVTF